MSSTSQPAELPPQLEAAISHIRAALTPGADVAAKEAAALSCRVLLSILEARPGQPIQVGTPAVPSSAAPLLPVGPIDLLLARIVEKHGADLPPDPSVPFLSMDRAAAVLSHALGSLR